MEYLLYKVRELQPPPGWRKPGQLGEEEGEADYDAEAASTAAEEASAAEQTYRSFIPWKVISMGVPGFATTAIPTRPTMQSVNARQVNMQNWPNNRLSGSNSNDFRPGSTATYTTLQLAVPAYGLSPTSLARTQAESMTPHSSTS